MRSVTAALGGISFLVVGFVAVSTAASSTEQAAVQNGTNKSASAWSATTGVFDGIGQAAAPAVVWAGVAAVVLVALGVLVYAHNGGR